MFAISSASCGALGRRIARPSLTLCPAEQSKASLLVLCVIISLPVSAGVGNNTNAEFVANIACEDGPTAPLVIATGQPGHHPAATLAGFATSI